MVDALPAYLQDFTRFAYLTGSRKGEITSLKWTDVDRDAGAIRLRPEAAKTGRGFLHDATRLFVSSLRSRIE